MQADAKRSFCTQTLRQIVHTSIGGTRARVQISNLFGTQPLKIEDAHIAQLTSGAAIDLQTDRTLLFHGQRYITIAPGASALSDPVNFAVPPFADVAISFYLPQSSASPTINPASHQTNYIAAGDVSGQAAFTNATATGSWYYITSLQVEALSSQGAIVTLGASITNGYKATDDTNHRWPDLLAQRLRKAGMNMAVLNAGISGNRLLVDGAGPKATTRFEHDVLAQPGIRWVIFSDDPINDLGSTHPQPTAVTLIAGVEQLIARAHQHGVSFLCSTLTPYEGANYWNEQGEAAREKMNAFLRSSASGCDGIVDQDTATHDPARPTRFLPAYDSGDHLHPNDAGMQAIANAVPLTLFDPAVPAQLDKQNHLGREVHLSTRPQSWTARRLVSCFTARNEIKKKRFSKANAAIYR